MLEIKWTIPARNSLVNHIEYISQDNPNVANQVYKHIYTLVQHLESTPNMGRIGRILGTRELVVNKYPFFIAYRVKDDFVEILKVVHTATKYPPNGSL